jgi:chromosomal replication initiator protein
MGPSETALVESYHQTRQRLRTIKISSVVSLVPKDDLVAKLTALVDVLSTRLTKLEARLSEALSPQSTELEPIVTVEQIIKVVCLHEKIRKNLLTSPRREDYLCAARHMVCYLAGMLTSRSLGQIGARLGNRDHTTILHGIDKLTAERASDMHLDARLSFYESLLSP